MANSRTRGVAPPPPVTANGHDVTTEHKDEPEVEIVGDLEAEVTTEAPAVRQPEGDEDPGVKALREQLAEETRKREAAEAEARRLAGERQQDARVLTDSRLLVIESTITAKEGKRDELKARIKAAKEAGDYDAETEAQSELVEVVGEIRQAKLGKDQLERQIEEAKAQPQSDDEKLEAFFIANNIGPRSREWLRGHKDYLTDKVKNAHLSYAHQLALDAGHALNTDGYFEAIETELGMRQREESETETTATTEQPRRQAAPAAPVSRAVDTGGQRAPIPGITVLGKGKYRVTQEIADAARMSGVTVPEYVEEAMKLQRGSDGQLH